MTPQYFKDKPIDKLLDKDMKTTNIVVAFENYLFSNL